MKIWLVFCLCEVGLTWRFFRSRRHHHTQRSRLSKLKAWDDQEAEERAPQGLKSIPTESISSFIENTIYQRARYLTDEILRRDHKLEYFWFVDYAKSLKEDFPLIESVHVEGSELNRLILFLACQPMKQIELLSEYQQVVFKAPINPAKVASILLTSKELALQEIKEWIPSLLMYETIFSEYIQTGRIEGDQIAVTRLERKLKATIPRTVNDLDTVITHTALPMIELELHQRNQPELWGYFRKLIEEEERSSVLDDLLFIQQDAPKAFPRSIQRTTRNTPCNTLPGIQRRLNSKTQQILYTLHCRQLKLEEEEQFTIGNTFLSSSSSNNISRAFKPRFTRSQPLLEEIDRLIRPVEMVASQLQSEDPLPLFTQQTSYGMSSSSRRSNIDVFIRQQQEEVDEAEQQIGEPAEPPQHFDDTEKGIEKEVEEMYQRLLQQQQMDPMLEDPFDRPTPPPQPPEASSRRKAAVNSTELNLIHHEQFHTALTTAKSLGTLLISKRNQLLRKAQAFLQELAVIYETEEDITNKMINDQFHKNARASAVANNPITSPSVMVKVVKGPLIIKSPAFVLGREYDYLVNTLFKTDSYYNPNNNTRGTDIEEEPLYFLVDTNSTEDGGTDPDMMMLPTSATRPNTVPLSDLSNKGGEVTGGRQDWNQWRSRNSNNNNNNNNSPKGPETAPQSEHKKSNTAVLDRGSRPNDYDSSFLPPRKSDNDDRNMESGEADPDPLDIPHGDSNDFLSLKPPISITVITTKVDPDDKKKYLLLQASEGILGTRERILAPYRRWVEYSQARELLMGITEEEMEEATAAAQQEDETTIDCSSEVDGSPFYGGCVPLL